jgi:hypothetical protein
MTASLTTSRRGNVHGLKHVPLRNEELMLNLRVPGGDNAGVILALIGFGFGSLKLGEGRFGVVITGVQRERLLDVGGAKA